MKHLFLLFLCCCLKFLPAQSLSPNVISSSGTSFNNGTSQLDWTLGEPITAAFNSSGTAITEGFHQPDLVVTSINNMESCYTVNVFPNPAIDVLQIQFHNLNETVFIELFDAKGKLIRSEQINSSAALLMDMGNYSAGTYLLSLKSGQSKSKTFQIIKTR